MQLRINHIRWDIESSLTQRSFYENIILSLNTYIDRLAMDVLPIVHKKREVIESVEPDLVEVGFKKRGYDCCVNVQLEN